MKRTLAAAEAELREAWHALAGAHANVDAHRAELGRMQAALDEANAKLAPMADEIARYRAEPPSKPKREPMPNLRSGGTFHPRIGSKSTGLSPHITANVYQDEGVTEISQVRVGELWIKLDDADANELGGGMADAAATMISIALQCGAPLQLLASKLVGLRGGPGGAAWKDYGAGLEPDREVDRCLSLLDYLGKWLLVHFCGYEPFVHVATKEEASG